MKPQPPRPVKLFAGLLYVSELASSQAIAALEEHIGHIDYRSPEFPFEISDYYDAELGQPIRRRFVSFRELRDPGDLAALKLRTNDIEEGLSIEGKRQVNIDPGYMDFNKVVLASAKHNSQKIYLGDGIYADPTLWYEKGRFKPYQWAFPDFQSGNYEATFLHVRSLMKAKRPGANES